MLKLDNVCYFPLKRNNQQTFDSCKDFIKEWLMVKNNTTYIRFHWQLVVIFATKPQLKAFHSLRKKYVRNLVAKHCDKALDCFAQYIGSDTPKSDVDIDIMCPTVETVIADIYKEHKSHFKDSLEEMFDTNLYGAVFRALRKECYSVTFFSANTTNTV